MKSLHVPGFSTLRLGNLYRKNQKQQAVHSHDGALATKNNRERVLMSGYSAFSKSRVALRLNTE